MMKKNVLGLCAALLFAAPAISQAAVYNVDARANSTSGGTGVAVGFNAGDAFTVSVNPLDLWNAGALPRWSNANGLTGANLLATGAADTNGDNPGVAAGTIIGPGAFGNHSQGGLSAPFGSLVGEWGNALGSYFFIGTNYAGVAAASTLNLYYFDSNNGDNTGSINVNIAAVPEPETYALMLAGLALVGFSARRRQH
ncbi:MAG TPA: FxDxF family PEP-CTERM protein [Methylotenera sp.]|nr:FxDxF family PEP-CTERM protein [Methylotenera sp.]HPH05133.1 FxDxF family PEP-CTERM protein [Methylotenera sp.]HPN00497.1 FxDxF family PEP-CTERM protein [Methylotenera sp.]